MSHSPRDSYKFRSHPAVKELDFHLLILSFSQQEEADSTCTQTTHTTRTAHDYSSLSLAQKSLKGEKTAAGLKINMVTRPQVYSI